MDFFEKFCSNSYAGSANQCYFESDGEIKVGRVFYKITAGGKYNYSLLFSNIIDSTFASGDKSHANLICSSWTIHSARIGRCRLIPEVSDIATLTVSDEGDGTSADITVSDFKEITFSGSVSKEVMPGEFFATDPIRLQFEKGEFLCLELTFSGRMIPYHEETMLPVFIKENGVFKYSKHMPFAGMIGIDREPRARVCYLGDSITQGIGVAKNSYKHWSALLSEKLGCDYAYWNLGIGYGRASDAASDGAWLYKAKQNDIVFVCYGVNDIYQGRTEAQIKADIKSIVTRLKNEGRTVILQTVPPFGYSGAKIEIWEGINEYIKTEIKGEVDFVFDCVPYLGEEGRPQVPKFGGHPNEKGSLIWADALFSAVGKLFI